MEGGRQTANQGIHAGPGVRLRVQVQEDYFIDYQTFKAIKDSKDVITLDARRRTLRRPEILDQARSYPRRDQHPLEILMEAEPALLKPDQEIQAILAKNGINPRR